MRNVAGSVAVAHFVGTYVSCLIYCAPEGWHAPVIAWFLASLLITPLLCLVLPYAGLMLFLLKRLGVQGRWAFAAAGAVVGGLALATTIYPLPGFFQEGRLLLVVASLTGGAAGGYVYRVMASLPARVERTTATV